jgi:LacI family repressor for deo operon, udp, cdd, tsx, nupC, and nupG
MSGQADGMIVLSHNLPLDLNPDIEIAEQLPPLVNASEPIDAPGFPKVMINNVTAAETAVNHLIELGHRNIAIITGEMESPSARDRLEGYYQALQKAGISINSSYIQHGNYCVESGINCTYRLLQQRPRPTAIFCCDDEMAIAAMQVAKSQGLSVPGNISLVGFDDIWCSEHQNPPLTTMRQPVNEMGTIAMNLLFDLINDNPCEPTTTYLPVELIPRASSGPVDPSA